MNRWQIVRHGMMYLVCIFSASYPVSACDCGDCGGVILSLLDGTVRYLSPGEHTLLRATASDYDTMECYMNCNETQEITRFDWYFATGLSRGEIYDPSPCSQGTSTVEVWSDTPGQYWVSVGAADNDGHYTSSGFTIWVISLDVSISDASVGIGDVAEVYLSWAPTSPLPPGCFDLCTSTYAGGDRIRVWRYSTKTTELIPQGGGNYVCPTSRFPHTVWIEGVLSGYATLYLDYRPICADACYPLYEWGEDTITVVQVLEVVKDGTTDTGPLYVVCPQDTIQLQAKPSPAGAVWPEGQPWWEPTGPLFAIVTPGCSSATVTASGFDTPGEYRIEAKCGINDVGDEITIITPPPRFYWEDFMPGFPCGPAGTQKCKEDHCGNRVAVYCDTNNSLQGLAYSWYYRPAGVSGRGTQVGICVWEGGQNVFQFKMVDENQYGKKRFLATYHVTKNDCIGLDPIQGTFPTQYEACDGYWCSRIERYDCVYTSPIGVWWRRHYVTPPATEYDGAPCPGPGSGNGVHLGYPN